MNIHKCCLPTINIKQEAEKEGREMYTVKVKTEPDEDKENVETSIEPTVSKNPIPNLKKEPESSSDESFPEDFASGFVNALVIQSCLSLLDSSSSDEDDLMLLWLMTRQRKKKFKKRRIF